MAQQGKLQEAIRAYENSLRLRPGDSDTKVNLQLARKQQQQLLQQQPQAQPQPLAQPKDNANTPPPGGEGATSPPSAPP